MIEPVVLNLFGLFALQTVSIMFHITLPPIYYLCLSCMASTTVDKYLEVILNHLVCSFMSPTRHYTRPTKPCAQSW